MPNPAPNAELLRSLGRLVRGLSMLFWGLPIALVVCVLTAMMGTFRSLNLSCFAPIASTLWLFIGLWQLGYFQKQERVWIQSLDHARWLALVNVGLSPFLYWWNQRPFEPWFLAMVGVMAFNGVLFLSSLNLVLHRLTAMLPDEALREETRQFTGLNRMLLLGILLMGILLLVLSRYPLPAMMGPLDFLLVLTTGNVWIWLLIFLYLLPLAMTMALLWKIKEVIMDSVFGAG